MTAASPARLLLAMTACAAAWQSAAPRTAAAESATAINRKVTDPVNTVWSLKLQNDLFLVDVAGHGDQVRDSVTFQPTLPVVLSEHLKLIPRPKFTFIDSKPHADSQGALRRATGLGDTVFDLVLSPRSDPWLLALGPTFVFPTATTDQTGQGKWQMGPGGVFGYKSTRWLAAVIFQQWVSFAGSAARRGVSELNLQYIASYFFDGGWSIGTSPTIGVDWRAASGDQVTFPFGPAIGKVLKLAGGLPVKFEIQALYIPIHPDPNGEQWEFQLTIIPVVASPQRKPLSGE